jgi:alpha/beta superfamily hydrolase
VSAAPAPVKEELAIAGPVGALEALLETPASLAPKALALICHPHPLHGGTMTNKVVYTLARAFVALGVAALRFNFRGVGASQGSHDAGVGEVEDAIAAATWLRDRWPGSALYLGGFSFGAAVAVRAAETIQPDGLVTVALPFERLRADEDPPDVPWLLLHGSEDELINLDALIDWLNGQPPGPELELIAEADHFFHGKLPELREGVEVFFRPLIAAAAAG